jgi:hypothetical protein
MEPTYGYIKDFTHMDGYKSCKYIFENISQLKVKIRPIIYTLNFFPQVWIREVINESPHDMIKLCDHFIKNKAPQEIKKDFQKTIKYYIFCTLFNVVGHENKNYYRKFNDSIEGFNDKKGIELLILFFKLGLDPEYKLLPKSAYSWRHQDLYLSYFEWDSTIFKDDLILIVGNVREELLYLFTGLDYYYYEGIVTVFFENKKTFSEFIYTHSYLAKHSYDNTDHKYEVSVVVKGDGIRTVYGIFCYSLCINYSYILEDDLIFSHQTHNDISKQDLIFEPNYYVLKNIIKNISINRI